MRVAIPKEVDEEIQRTFSFASAVDEWLTVKKLLVNALAPEFRSLFSKRDPITKKQVPNDFDRAVAKRWSKLTGRSVIFTPEHEEQEP